MASKLSGLAKRRKKQVAYPNSPLVEVVFEIRFSGEPAVECRRDEFFRLIRKDFPTVWVPSVEVGQSVALQPYHFKSADGAETVMIAMNRFAYATRRYTGFEHFCPRALRLVQPFCSHYGIQKLNRTGLRYINLIPFVREDGAIPWRRHFTIEGNLPETSPNDLLNINLAYETRCKAGVITTRITCGRSANDGREGFVLDFDFAKTGALNASALKTYMAESHDYTKRVFEGIVCDDYRAVMRGKVIS